MQLVKTLTRVGIIAAAATMMATATPAFAASRDGVCNTGEFCYYFNSGEAGSISDFTGSIADYGTTQPSCYDFKGAGNGKGVCVKNNAASVWNRSSKTVRVYFNSGYAGAHQDFAPGAKGNLNATLKNQNASHEFLTSTVRAAPPPAPATRTPARRPSPGPTATSAAPRSAPAPATTSWAWPTAGRTAARTTPTRTGRRSPRRPSTPGVRTVPAGGLAFFKGGSSGFGHVMISLGGGSFASTDVGTDGRYHAGRYGKTTIATIESSFGETYLGWTQPWFNH